MRAQTYLLVMALLVGGCGPQEETPAQNQGKLSPERAPDAGVAHFYGITQPADDVVYLIDKSGSMLVEFYEIRMTLLKSVNRLSPDQRFHVIFYSSGKPAENPPRKLVLATEESKAEFEKFLRTIDPEGQTDPIPAIKRAFEVVESGHHERSVIYLLTDGEFPDSKAVTETITRLNKNERVSINTILFYHQSPEAMRVMRVLKKIAAENDGVFRFVPTP